MIAALFSAGAQGVQETDDGVLTHFPPDAAIGDIERRVLEADPDATLDTWEVEESDWSHAWQSGIGAHALGRLTIAPPWMAGALDPDTTIVIEPGMAFGTGEHATTRGVVRLLQDVVREGDLVADLGSGSGVLAIAAAKLGASRVVAVEIDPDAISNAEENVAVNHVDGRVTVIEGDAVVLLPLMAPVRVVLANIISSVLVALLPIIDSALSPDGVAILSGILQVERPGMLQLLHESGWRVEAEDEEDIWWSVRIARGASPQA